MTAEHRFCCIWYLLINHTILIAYSGSFDKNLMNSSDIRTEERLFFPNSHCKKSLEWPKRYFKNLQQGFFIISKETLYIYRISAWKQLAQKYESTLFLRILFMNKDLLSLCQAMLDTMPAVILCITRQNLLKNGNKSCEIPASLSHIRASIRLLLKCYLWVIWCTVFFCFQEESLSMHTYLI